MTGHVHEWNHTRKNLICNVKHSYYARFFLSATQKHSKAVVCEYEESTGYKCFVQELIYRRLGGLTGARLNLIWICDDSYKKPQPGMQIL